MIGADLILAILGVAGVCTGYAIGRRKGFSEGAKQGYAYALDPNDASLYEVRPFLPKNPQYSWVIISPAGEHIVGRFLNEVTYRAARLHYGDPSLVVPTGKDHGNLQG